MTQSGINCVLEELFGDLEPSWTKQRVRDLRFTRKESKRTPTTMPRCSLSLLKSAFAPPYDRSATALWSAPALSLLRKSIACT
jgi:hypothetical protein